MNVTLLAGVVLFVCGLAAAVTTMVWLGGLPESGAATSGVPYVIWPVVAGLLLSVGGLLLGVSLGNWRHPRTRLEPGDKVVNPEGYHTMKHV